jgi:hypothetical protein
MMILAAGTTPADAQRPVGAGNLIADHERDPVRLLAEVDQQVARLLGGPLPGGMLGDAEDADAPGGVLDHGQDIGLSAVQQVGREEAARQQ